MITTEHKVKIEYKIRNININNSKKSRTLDAFEQCVCDYRVGGILPTYILKDITVNRLQTNGWITATFSRKSSAVAFCGFCDYVIECLDRGEFA